MGDIIQYNVRGLKSIDTRQNKVNNIVNLLSSSDTKFVSLQETRLSERTQIPRQFLHWEHIYHIFLCGATESDPGSGILIFVKKTEEILKESVLFEGRLAHVQTRNLVTGYITNFFSFYGKSNVNRDFAKMLISKLDNEIESNNLENLIIVGDFNFVTSTNDRNTNKYTQTDNVYRGEWNNFEIKHTLLESFRKIYPNRRLYTFS